MPMKQPRPETKQTPSRIGRHVVGLLAVLAANAACAQDAGSGETPHGLFVKPRVSVSETYTDNNLLTSNNRDAALITTVSPGVSISARGGSISGTLDYSLSGIAYLKSDQPDRLQNNLNAQGRIDFVPQVFFVNAYANISQQSNSPLGAQSVDSNLANPNRVETQTLTIAPTLQGHFGGLATYQLQGSATGTNQMDTAVGDSHQLSGSFRMDGLNAGQLRWWSLLSTTQSHFKTNAANNNDDQAMLGLRYQPDVDFFMTASAGKERSNYLTGKNEDAALYGASFSWTPTVRTTLNLDWQHHNYGDSHSFKFEHRMSRSVWSVSDNQSVTQASQLNQADLGSNYDLLFVQFASIEPDPVKRDALVRAYLQTYGLNPGSQNVVGFLSNVPVLSHSSQASFALEGARTTATATLTRTTSRQLGENSQTAGPLLNFSLINQQGFSVNVAHKLTPLSSLSAAYTQTRGSGAGGIAFADSSNTLHSLTANWTSRLGRRGTLTLMVRHAQEVGANPYRESAMSATFVQTF
jgi:uncharacterized protein (PEP-CTERM system associated)